MTTDPSSGPLIAAPVYIAASVAAWWLFDAQGLKVIDWLNSPAWDRSVPGVERPAFDPDAVITLASGDVAIVRVMANVKQLG